MTKEEIKTFEKEFDKRFPNLNDSTNEGGYDAKEYVKSFFIQHAAALIEGRVRELRKKLLELQTSLGSTPDTPEKKGKLPIEDFQMKNGYIVGIHEAIEALIDKKEEV